jgi:hypothetical protein
MEQTMRSLLFPVLPFVVWLGILQLPVRTIDPRAPDDLATLLSLAAGLTGLTVAVYRLGVWREQMNNAKQNVGAQVARHREEANQHFANIEQRLGTIERYVAGGVEQRVALERWQGRVDTTLESHARRLDALSSEEDAA